MSMIEPKSFKVITTGPKAESTGTPAAQPQYPHEIPSAGGFLADDLADVPGAPKPNSNPLDDYFFGDIIEGQVARIQGETEQLSSLESAVPSVEEVLIANPNAAKHLDTLLGKYKTTEQRLTASAAKLNDLLLRSQLSPKEVEALQTRLALTRSLIVKAQAQVDKVAQLQNRRAEMISMELRTLKDLDGDGIVGDRERGWLVVQNPNGQTVFLDPKSKRPVPTPLLAPDYTPVLANTAGLRTVTVDKVDEELRKEKADLNLEISPMNSSGTLQSVIDMQVPELLWVARNPDSNKPQWRIDGDGRRDPSRYQLYNQFDAESGLKQKVPADQSQYMQVKVAKVVVRSIADGKPENLHARGGYHHVVEFYDSNRVIIARITIQGVTEQGKYFAASSVGFHLGGDNRWSAVEVDASKMQSTVRHVVDDNVLAEKTGVRVEQGNPASLENIGLFTDPALKFPRREKVYVKYDSNGAVLERWPQYSYKSEWNRDERRYQQGQEKFQQIEKDKGLREQYTLEYHEMETNQMPQWANGEKLWRFPTSPYNHDVYVPREDAAVDGSPIDDVRTGIMITGLRGKITGTNYNDIIALRGANVIPQHLKEKYPWLADRAPKTEKFDPEYNNVVDGGGGHNIVTISGKGHNFWKNATYASITNSDASDLHYVAIKDNPVYDTKNDVDLQRNIRNYVRINSGESYILNTLEAPNTDALSAENKRFDKSDKVITPFSDAVRNDYFNVQGSSAHFANPEDDDLYDVAAKGVFDRQDAWDYNTGFRDSYESAAKSLIESIGKLPEIDDAAATEAATRWEQEYGGAAGDLADEMNSFFDTMFGEVRAFNDDYDIAGTSADGTGRGL